MVINTIKIFKNTYQKTRLVAITHVVFLIFYSPLQSMETKKDKEFTKAVTERDSLLPHDKVWRKRILGWLFLTLTIVCYYIAVTAAQISGLEVNIYQLYACRYIIQFTITACIIAYKKASIQIKQEDIKYFLVFFGADLFQSPPFYMATTFMPVGNSDAFFNALFIVTSGIYDIVRKEISAFRMFCCIVVIAGIILITQPWLHAIQEASLTPCEYFENSNISFPI